MDIKKSWRCTLKGNYRLNSLIMKISDKVWKKKTFSFYREGKLSQKIEMAGTLHFDSIWKVNVPVSRFCQRSSAVGQIYRGG